ncbi:MAG: transcriptional regulator [Desulforudis sp.]|jgi:DNA-binding FrmR family transcriptional regulator|nr:metal-sensitive transcriptional regulator [Clostridia bacterium]RJX20990.1 MAG: transcriptional regulator [Desulforudis sp.]
MKTGSEKQQVVQSELLSRLKKIEGQVRGVQKMIQDGRSCGDIVIQLGAIKAAVNRVGITVLGCHLAEKIENDLREDNDVNESLADFITIFKRFS